MPKQAMSHIEAIAKMRECSFSNPDTLQLLKTIVKDHVSSQQSIEWSPIIQPSNLIKYHDDGRRPGEFSVTRQREESAFKPRIGQPEEFDESVMFRVEGRNLRVEYQKKTDSSSNVRETIWVKDVSPDITETGECRYEIDGGGSYVLWKVVHKALKPLFLPDLV